MALHTAILRERRATSTPLADGAPRARLETELAEASAILVRLLEAEDRLGLVFGVMDDARRFLAARPPHGGTADWPIRTKP
jgi:hypothetical protein